ncbi:unnamed protein product [Strongylus vulgaris]|uniref:Nematode cuticle collagen N-terminal domain-containing protein n=1 Tax=Strongylus vulgaris TaxID=40348 RepID=A0A3P7IH59_STRVU|nr:unnamed protein product [Strongylus vulgaris]
MIEDKVIVAAASACSLLAIGACLAVLPSLYYEINQVHDQVSYFGCNHAIALSFKKS